MKNKPRILLILTALLAVLCLMLAACGGSSADKPAGEEPVAVSEQSDEAAGKAKEQTEAGEEAKAEEEAKAKAEEEAKAKEEAEQKAEKEKAEKEKAAKEKAEKEKASKDKAKKDNSSQNKAKKKTDKKDTSKDSSSSKKTGKKESSKDSGSSKETDKKDSSKDNGSSKKQPEEKKKVWVEPVTETRTVTLDTGTRYCNGAKSGGGCGASWHGSKDSTYNSWHKHWQDYVKKRTAEEEAKGKTYVCDHIHDDSKWVPDTATETVVVKDGYWKEVD